MMKKLFKTNDELAPLILRLALAVVMFPHGAQKVLGWFGGHGFSATMSSFTEKMHIPAPFAFLAILAEFGGSLALFFGLLTRISAFGIGTTMAVAIFMGHAQNGFFMNWSGKQTGEGFEYHILAIAIALALMCQGGGKLALDSMIYRKLNNADAFPKKV
ncbi:MAG: DoxX family protein [Verrucomicrobiota bacterium]